jgi:hypothetical protein
LIGDVLLDALELELAGEGVSRGEAAFLARRIPDLEVARRETVRLRVAEARNAVVVPEHAVIARRDDEWHRDVAVVLDELEIFPVEVEMAVLMLTATEQSFVAAIVEALRHSAVEGAPRLLREQRLVGEIRESHGAIRQRHVRAHERGFEQDLAVGFRHFEWARLSFRGRSHEALRSGEALVGHRGDADQAIVDDAQPDVLRGARRGLDDQARRIRGESPFRLGRRAGREQRDHQHAS